jgi:hypothetical protein
VGASSPGASFYGEVRVVVPPAIGSEPLGFVRPPELAALLHDDHDELEALATSFLALVEDHDRETVRRHLEDLEVRVFEHIEAEERHLIFRYMEEDPDDARAIWQEHAALRRSLTQLGIAVDLLALRVEDVRVFVETLRAHGRRESAGLYRWAARIAAQG